MRQKIKAEIRELEASGLNPKRLKFLELKLDKMGREWLKEKHKERNVPRRREAKKEKRKAIWKKYEYEEFNFENFGY